MRIPERLRGRGFYHRLAVGGFIVFAVGSAIPVALLAAIGQAPPQAGQLVTFLVIGLVAAILLLATTWLLVPMLLLSLMLLLVSGFLAPFGLAHPDSFVDFFSSITAIVGSFVAIVGCSVCLVRRRHHRDGRRFEHITVAVGLVGLVMVGLVSAGLTAMSTTHGDVPPGAIVVNTERNRFVPSTLHFTIGRHEKVLVVNDDSYAHTFSIDGTEFDEYVGPHSQRLINITISSRFVKDGQQQGFIAPGAPRLTLSCSVVGHDKMRGTIVLRPSTTGS